MDTRPNSQSGKGTGVILKELSVKYKAPVTYSDTVRRDAKISIHIPRLVV